MTLRIVIDTKFHFDRIGRGIKPIIRGTVGVICIDRIFETFVVSVFCFFRRYTVYLSAYDLFFVDNIIVYLCPGTVKFVAFQMYRNIVTNTVPLIYFHITAVIGITVCLKYIRELRLFLICCCGSRCILRIPGSEFIWTALFQPAILG